MTTEMVNLTKREWQVVNLMMEGWTYSTMGRKLGVSESAIKFHIQNIYQKMDCCTQVQVIVKAIRLGMITIPVDSNVAA